MLTQIHIRDLATIAELSLSFSRGNTMITGETGAGKSIFIEAIELALGGRASANLIRPGKEKAEITLCFDIANFPKVISQLKNLDLYQDVDECLIRRIIMADGRSRCYVNGIPATVQLTKELGEHLFHLHGQHEQQILINQAMQREMLDRFANALALAQQVKQLAEQYKGLQQQLAEIKQKNTTGLARSEYLRFQLEELQALNLKPNEWSLLESEHHRLSHSEELIQKLQHAVQILQDQDALSLQQLANELRKIFESAQAIEPKASVWRESLETIVIQLNDLQSELENYLARNDLDPERLQQLEQRVSQIFALSRKHKIKPDELCQLCEQFQQELTALNSYGDEITRLTEECEQIAAKHAQVARQLSERRKKAAVQLEKEITQIIRSLSLPHGEFKIVLEEEAQRLGLHGNERVVFHIKTNPDQSLQAIAKVISGGELSRLSLALHLVLASKTNIPTLIFDEVDTGLSGATAEKIGKLLRKLGETYQVFCITHQAQVAACGHHHLLVEKYIEEKRTHTRLKLLQGAGKAREIARMLGGETITQKTLEHAKEILNIHA
jgi:DNA repair protein RecN (Recombination protein N)